MTQAVAGALLLDARVIDDPYPFYAQLRAEAPVWEDANRKGCSIAVPCSLIGEILRHPMHQQQAQASERTFFRAGRHVGISLDAWVEHRPAIHHLGDHPVGRNPQADRYRSPGAAVNRNIGQ
jgi:hypothetical protein